MLPVIQAGLCCQLFKQACCRHCFSFAAASLLPLYAHMMGCYCPTPHLSWLAAVICTMAHLACCHSRLAVKLIVSCHCTFSFIVFYLTTAAIGLSSLCFLTIHTLACTSLMMALVCSVPVMVDVIQQSGPSAPYHSYFLTTKGR